MKIYITTTFLLLSFAFHVNAQKTLHQLEHHDVWDSVSNTWINLNHVLYTYNNDGTIAQKLTQNNNQKNIEKTDFEYDNFGNIISETISFNDTLTNIWRPSFRRITNYHQNKFIKEERNELWNKDINQWQLSSRKINDYNINNDIILLQIEQVINGDTTITLGERTDITYNINNNKSKETFIKYNSGLKKWDTINRVSYEYNAKGLTSFQIIELYNTTSLTWDSVHKQTYTYNNLDTLKQVKTFLFDKNTGTWMNNELYDNINWIIWNRDISEQENIASYLYKRWSDLSNTYEIQKSFTKNILDAFGSNVSTVLSFQNNLFVPEQEFTNLFDSHFNKTYYHIRNGVNGAWTNFYEELYEYSYGSNDELIEKIIWVFNFNITALQKAERVRFENFITLGLQSKSNTLEASLYPNPSNNRSVNIDINLVEASLLEIEVTDLNGKIVYSESTQREKGMNTLKLDGLSKGMFVVRLRSENGTFRTKLLVTGE